MSGKAYRDLNLSKKLFHFSGLHWPLSQSGSLGFCQDHLNICPLCSRSGSNHLLQKFPQADCILPGLLLWLTFYQGLLREKSSYSLCSLPELVFFSQPTRQQVFEEPEWCVLLILLLSPPQCPSRCFAELAQMVLNSKDRDYLVILKIVSQSL